MYSVEFWRRNINPNVSDQTPTNKLTAQLAKVGDACDVFISQMNLVYEL